MEGMDKIKDTLISIGSWIFGGFLLFLSLSIFLPHGFIAGLLFLLAAIVSIPLTAAKLENQSCAGAPRCKQRGMFAPPPQTP